MYRRATNMYDAYNRNRSDFSHLDTKASANTPSPRINNPFQPARMVETGVGICRLRGCQLKYEICEGRKMEFHNMIEACLHWGLENFGYTVQFFFRP